MDCHVCVPPQKRLEKQLHTSLNITFPAVACDDLVIESIDIGGDSNIIKSLAKIRLNADGERMGVREKKVADLTYEEEKRKYEQGAVMKSVRVEVAGYCGSCYGAHSVEGQCCNTCDELIKAYSKKRWSKKELTQTAEQCKEEFEAEKAAAETTGEKKEEKPKPKPKLLRKGEGCNVYGDLDVNRVGGIFHFHVDTGSEINWMEHKSQIELSEDATKFNPSHIVHELSFGPTYQGMEFRGMDNLNRTVENAGENTGLFMYYCQLVPTTYKGADMVQDLGRPTGRRRAKKWTTEIPTVDTVQYFYTEKFEPFSIEGISQDGDEDKDAKTKTQGSFDFIQQIMLPGVFFQYELYPFSVEITKNSAPLRHLLIKLMATAGGVITIVGWVQALFSTKGRRSTSSLFPK
mmetsp:Transcript_22848/g.30368  ORF Transcript_22848/g.30368 Transcript_22848/m.30368 type:complete len:404 (+) Transcript_22848:2-1213(+)